MRSKNSAQAAMPSPDRRAPGLLAVCGAVLLLGGCLSVAPSVLREHGDRLYIPMVANKTLEYGAEELITDVLTTQFARDGRLTVVETAPDLIFDATLVQYRLTGRDYDEDNRVIGKSLTVTVEAAVIDARNGEIVVPGRPYTASGTFYADAQPDLRREGDVFLRLSQSMISRIVEGW